MFEFDSLVGIKVTYPQPYPQKLWIAHGLFFVQ